MINKDLIILDSVNSTNTYLKELAQKGQKENTIVIAKSQTEGRGRVSKSFYSPDGGLYMSFLLRPQGKINCADYTVKASVAICHVVEKLSNKKAQIKWVNDIYVENKKVCGILTEGAINQDLTAEYVIVGIGVNLFKTKEVPAELENIIGFVFDQEQDVLKTANEIIDEFYAVMNENVIDEYRNRSYLNGKEVYIILGNETFSAKVLEIDENCNLVIEREDGVQKLFSGEVSVKPK